MVKRRKQTKAKRFNKMWIECPHCLMLGYKERLPQEKTSHSLTCMWCKKDYVVELKLFTKSVDGNATDKDINDSVRRLKVTRGTCGDCDNLTECVCCGEYVCSVCHEHIVEPVKSCKFKSRGWGK